MMRVADCPVWSRAFLKNTRTFDRQDLGRSSLRPRANDNAALSQLCQRIPSHGGRGRSEKAVPLPLLLLEVEEEER